MSKELALVILLNRSCFDKCSIRRIEHLLKSGIDWFQVFNLSVQRQTAYLTYSVLRDLHYLHLLPETVRTFWTVSYYGNIRRNQRLMEEATKLVTELKKMKTPVYPIKGITLLKNVYNNTGLRYSRDIDFLVPPQYYIAICNTLEQLQLELLYINGADPYLCSYHMQGCHSLFYTRKRIEPYDIDFCCEFSFSLFKTEEHSQLFQYITESLAMSALAPEFHATHILLLCLYYFHEMKKRGFPKDLENENLMKLVDIYTYLLRYWGNEVRCELKKSLHPFELHPIC